MATAGNLIAKENFSTSWAFSWNDSHSNKDQKRYVYICAPAWYVVGTASYYAFGGSGVFQIYFSYWTGSSWSLETHVEISATNGGLTRNYGHNRDEGNLSGSFHGEYHLWRIRYWPSRSNSRWKIYIYAGGWGVAKNSSGAFLNYPKGKKIYSKGRTGDCIHAAGTSEAAVYNSTFNPTNRRGNPISAAYDHELINIPYLN